VFDRVAEIVCGRFAIIDDFFEDGLHKESQWFPEGILPGHRFVEISPSCLQGISGRSDPRRCFLLD
jgi:hypothetical protein